MSAEFPDHPFWDFSLQVYMTEGVGPACIALQERHQIDVNILMFLLWLAASGRGAASDADLAAIMTAAGPWHREVVRRIRQVRTRMKGGFPPAPGDLAESLRKRIGKIEVDCEHVEQLVLAATVDSQADSARPPGARAADAGASIARYFAAIGAPISAEDRLDIAAVMRVAFKDMPVTEINSLCGRIAA